jgi:hypothetical protein
VLPSKAAVVGTIEIVAASVLLCRVFQLASVYQETSLWL